MPRFATNGQKATIQILRKKLPEHTEDWWRDYVRPYQSLGRVSKLTYRNANKLIRKLKYDLNEE